MAHMCQLDRHFVSGAECPGTTNLPSTYRPVPEHLLGPSRSLQVPPGLLIRPSSTISTLINHQRPSCLCPASSLLFLFGLASLSSFFVSTLGNPQLPTTPRPDLKYGASFQLYSKSLFFPHRSSSLPTYCIRSQTRLDPTPTLLSSSIPQYKYGSS